MAAVIALAAFAGSWLLVAGPVYQAAVELHGERVDREAIAERERAAPSPPSSSPWWWLLPPVALLRHRREARLRRAALARLLSPEQLDQLMRFGAKATGWLMVASGGALILIREAAELVDALGWSPVALWVLIPVSLIASAAHATIRMRRDDALLAASRASRAGAPSRAGSDGADAEGGAQ